MKNFYSTSYQFSVNTSNKEQKLDSGERLKRKVLIQESRKSVY